MSLDTLRRVSCCCCVFFALLFTSTSIACVACHACYSTSTCLPCGTHARINTHTCMHAYTHTHARTHTHPHTHTHTRTRTHARIYTHMHACLHMADVHVQWGLCEYVMVHTILGGSPVILWISLGGKPKWLPLKFGYHDIMRTSPFVKVTAVFCFRFRLDRAAPS